MNTPVDHIGHWAIMDEASMLLKVEGHHSLCLRKMRQTSVIAVASVTSQQALAPRNPVVALIALTAACAMYKPLTFVNDGQCGCGHDL